MVKKRRIDHREWIAVVYLAGSAKVVSLSLPHNAAWLDPVR
jgi:hypothetical protein